MRAVMKSVSPEICEKLSSGDCKILISKTAPKCDAPFKSYIYATKAKKWFHSGIILTSDELLWLSNGKIKMCDGFELWADGEDYQCVNGKVIGEFVCDKVYKWECKNRLEILESFPIWRASYMLFVDDLEKTCLTYNDLWDYGNGKSLYGWHISDLKIYDKPKKLSEFYTKKMCNSCKKSGYESTACMYDEDCKVPMPINRAPSNWQYVEEL